MKRSDKIFWLFIIVMFILMIIGINKCPAQVLFKDCPIGGSVRSYDDSMKNRYAMLTQYVDYSFDDIADLKLNAPMPVGGVCIKGYCLLVKDGGPETCNCKTKNKDQWDVHIEITKDSRHTSNKDAIVCEINGRIKAYIASRGGDWSVKTLKKTMVGRMVEIGGYGFYDDHHKQNSVVDNPNGTTLWRSTTFEIHPVTYIKILD